MVGNHETLQVALLVVNSSGRVVSPIWARRPDILKIDNL